PGLLGVPKVRHCFPIFPKQPCGFCVVLRYSVVQMSALDELLSSWRANPDAESTVALCSYLGVAAREDLIREVASSAETWHAEDPAVMLAVGRMYLDAGMLPESQAILVAAGRLNARDPVPFRYLGEVLLRRGDAVRSEKLLARSIQLGMTDANTRLWH